MDPDDFLDKRNVIAVVGVSSDPEKWGSKIFKTLKSSGFDAYPINPKHKDIQGEKCYPCLGELPKLPDVVITAVPPKVTEDVTKECNKIGVDKIWMQPGSESEGAIEICKESGINAIYNACFIVDGLSGNPNMGKVTFACKKITHEELIRCSFDLNKTEYNVLMFLLKDGESSEASEIGNRMGLERSTVQKAISGLWEKNLVRRTRRNLPKGGYTYIYRVEQKDGIKSRMEKIVYDWYKGVKKEIDLL